MYELMCAREGRGSVSKVVLAWIGPVRMGRLRPSAVLQLEGPVLSADQSVRLDVH